MARPRLRLRPLKRADGTLPLVMMGFKCSHMMRNRIRRAATKERRTLSDWMRLRIQTALLRKHRRATAA